MKFKKKLTALAVTLAMTAAGSANAAIDIFSLGNGELFFSIRDNTNLTSYILDLNVTMDAWNGAVNQSFAADATLTSYLGSGSGNYSWAVMAGDSATGGTVGGLRYLTTAAAGMASTWATEANSGLLGYAGMETSYLVGANAAIAAGATGNSATFTSTDTGYFSTDFDNWSFNTPMNAAAAGLGGEQSFYLGTNSNVTTNPILAAQKIAVTEQAGTWMLAANGNLSYNTVSAVPIPAAVWLLGSAMVGLVGVARRREEDGKGEQA